MIQIIEPLNRDHWLSIRRHDITSTEIAALFGISPYATEFELWHRKHGMISADFEANERMKWGTRLESAIAHGIAEDHGWQIRKMSEYIRDDELNLGASFDYAIGDYGLLEIKNVDALIFRDGWTFDEDGNLEAPLHIEIQVQQQLMLSQRAVCYIGALVGGNKVVMIERQPDKAVHAEIKAKALKFWDSIQSSKEPSPDFIKDAEFISKLYQYAEPGKVVDASGDSEFAMWAVEYKRLGDEIKMSEEVRDGYKARMLQRIGDAEKVLGSGFTVSAGVVGEADISYKRKAYRTFRCSWKKQK